MAFLAESAVTAQSGGIAIGQLTYPRSPARDLPIRLDPRVAHVVGRDDLFAAIQERFSAAEFAVVTVALCGLGGVGKTTAAVDYAHQHVGEYALVWHLHAEDATGLLAQFGELAQLLDPDDLLDRADPVARVHAALAAMTRPWLLVMDNVPDHGAARRWLPPKGPGRVLVTTRDGHWPEHQALAVDPLEATTAAHLLLDSTHQLDLRSARSIAERLGALPLALAQAAAYIETTGTSLADYLGLLREHWQEVLSRGTPTEYHIPVAQTWSVSMASIAETTPGAVTLLRLLAFMAPEDIPFRLLLTQKTSLPRSLKRRTRAEIRRWHTDRFALDDAVSALRRHSLIGPPTDGSVSMHRLVQAVTIDQIPAGQTDVWSATAAALVSGAIPADVEDRAAWPRCAMLLPHARVVLEPLSEDRWNLAHYLGACGDYATARDVWADLAEAHSDRLGPDHLDTITARARLAYRTGQAGDPAAARDQFAHLIPVYQQVLGANHPDTLTARGNLANWTGQAGDAPAARDQFAALLPVQEHVLGPNHPDTLATRGNLASWTGYSGSELSARNQFASLLTLFTDVLGPKHPNTLAAHANLAYWTGQAGHAQTARDEYAALLPLGEQVLGPHHRNTLATHANLAHWTGQSGDARSARDQYAALLPLSERILGPNHPDTLTTRDRLASWTEQAARGD